MQHKIPISATFTLFKYINVVPSFNYTERWYMRKVEQSYDPSAPNNVRRDTINGFNRVYNYDLSLQVNTKMYGFYKPWKKLFGDKIEIDPSRLYSFGEHELCTGLQYVQVWICGNVYLY